MRAPRHAESGFTLIELLVTTSIIGILAAIAIPQYANYKAQSIDATMKSSLRNARTAIENYFVEHATYETVQVADLEANGYSPTDGVVLKIETAGASEFALRACANGGTAPSYLYTSNGGGLDPDPATC